VTGAVDKVSGVIIGVCDRRQTAADTGNRGDEILAISREWFWFESHIDVKRGER
jgi:hypothetical protein